MSHTPITEHFALEEMACKTGAPYPIDTYEDEGDITPALDEPRTWRWTRLQPLCETAETVRKEAGGLPMTVDSGFRTLAYDQRLYDADAGRGNVAKPQGSQHPKGRAMDLVHSTLKPPELFNLIMKAFAEGNLPHLGGIGLYSTFVHIDVRPRGDSNHLAIWGGTRPSNIV
jgi:hypothetical protein